MNKRVKMAVCISALFFSLDSSLLAGGLSDADDGVGQKVDASRPAERGGDADEIGRGSRTGDDYGRGRAFDQRGRFKSSTDRFGEAWESDGTGGFRGVDDGVDGGWRD